MSLRIMLVESDGSVLFSGESQLDARHGAPASPVRLAPPPPTTTDANDPTSASEETPDEKSGIVRVGTRTRAA